MAPKKPFSKVGGPTTVQEHSLLLRLPAELRNMIYELALSVEVEIPRRRRRPPYGCSTPPGLLLACKQTYAEAIGLFYATATFYFGYRAYYRLKQWVRKIGKDSALLLKDIHFAHYSHPWPSAHWYFNPDVQDSAKEAQSWLRYAQAEVELPLGVLKVQLPFERGKVWTAFPVEVAKEALAVSAWLGEVKRVWTAEPSERLKRLLPFIEEVTNEEMESLRNKPSLYLSGHG